MVVAGAALALAMPGPAFAHGLTGRADLPIPIWLFSWGAAVVMVVSFAALATLWTKPRLEDDRFRPLPDALGRVLTSRGMEILCGLVGVLLLVVVIVCGFAGAQVASQNLAPTFVYVVFWLGFVPVCVVFGDVFRAFNPWRAVGRARRLAGAGLGAAPVSRAARPLAGGGRPLRLRVARAGHAVRRPSRDDRVGDRRLLGRDLVRDGRSTASRPGPGAARPSRSTSGSSRCCRCSSCAAACWACGRS